jgi:glycosyltransferase involved in cell wall biosynthesis
MRFALFVPNLSEQKISQSYFERMILKAFENISTRHEFYLITNKKLIEFKHPLFKIISLEDFFPSLSVRIQYKVIKVILAFKFFLPYKVVFKFEKILSDRLTQLDTAIIYYNIRAVWFVSGAGSPSERIPSITTHWDCNHLVTPYFPEFSYTRYGFDVLQNEKIRMVNKSSFIISGTEIGKKQIIQFYGADPNKIKVIPFFPPQLNDFTDIHFADEKDIDSSILNESYIFYPAQFIPHKNHIVLLKALQHLHSKYTLNLKCILVGRDKGNLKYLKSKVSEYGLSESVIILDVVSNKSIVLLYKNALALTFCSLNGPDNLPPLEAFSLGCPVIASAVPGAEEQLGEDAILFKPTDYNELGEAIYKMYSDKELREEYIKKGFKKLEKYTADKYIKGVLDIFDEFEPILDCWEGNNITINKN